VSGTLTLASAAAVAGAGSASYGPELGAAAAPVAVALLIVGVLWHRSKGTAAHGGLVTGADNRISTSKTIAVVWTLVVAWMVVAEAFVAAFPKHPPNTFSGLLASASDLYFVFLGGPYAAAAFAKATTQSKIAQGTLTKTPGTPAATDLISDDNGNVDLYDFQYVLFNILALLIVAISFGVHPDRGLPDVPAFLAILTGGSALTYTVNKATAADAPQITSVTPANARIGDVIKITGVQLFSTNAGGTLPTVTIGGISATGVAIPTGATDTLTATVADAPPGTTPLAGTTRDVVVSPPLASPITARNAITIVADVPKITAVKPQPVTANAQITVTGTLLLTPGTQYGTADPGTTEAGGVTPNLSAAGTPWPVSLEGPYSDSELTLRVGPQPANLVGPGTIGDASLTLTLTRAVQPPPPTTVKYKLT
jgi:hypothetical protein